MDPHYLANLLDEFFTAGPRSWHPAMPAALDGIDLALATWRPAPHLYSIWDLVNHMAYEHMNVRHRLQGLTGSATPFAPPGHTGLFYWPQPEEPATAEGWDRAVQRLKEAHRDLVAQVRSMTHDQLQACPPGRTEQKQAIVEGLLAHNSYHCGQIILIRRMGQR